MINGGSGPSYHNSILEVIQSRSVMENFNATVIEYICVPLIIETIPLVIRPCIRQQKLGQGQQGSTANDKLTLARSSILRVVTYASVRNQRTISQKPNIRQLTLTPRSKIDIVLR